MEKFKLVTYTQKDFKRAHDALSELRDVNNEMPSECINSIVEKEKVYKNKDFNGIQLKDLYQKQSMVQFCSFSGSTFDNSACDDIQLEGNNFSFCVFRCCKLSCTNPTYFAGNNLGQSQFIDCKFQNIIFQASTLGQSQFIDCYFENCEFLSCTMEGTEFINCDFKNVSMRSLNLAYSVFRNCRFESFYVALFQFALVYGCREIYSQYKREIIFCAKGKELNYNDFENLIDTLRVYYSEKKNYFAIINLLLLQKNKKLAYNYMRSGLNSATEEEDFRMVAHYCRLGKMYNLISAHQARDILDEIDNAILSMKTLGNKTSIYVLNQALINCERIRQLLLCNTTEQQVLQLEVATNIPIEDSVQINKLQNQLQGIIDCYTEESVVSFIEIRHSSPACFLIQFITDHPDLVLSVSYALLKFLTFVGKKVINYIKNNNNPEQYFEEIKTKYDAKLNVSDNQKGEMLKDLVVAQMETLKYQISGKTEAAQKRIVTSVTQKIINSINTVLPDDKSYLILTTK